MILGNDFLIQFILAMVLAAVVSFAAFRFNLVTRSGAWTAFGLGWLTFGMGGLPWAIVLLVFFVSSSVLSRFFKKRKTEPESNYANGSRRDKGQVLANGGVAGMFVVLHLFFPSSILPWIGFCASLAAANADTWATELGVLNQKKPILITSGKPVTIGTSGAISLVGTLAAAAGALFVALVSGLLSPIVIGDINRFGFVGVVAIAGLIGSLVDSLLGATIQAVYFCATCGCETEKHPVHSCGGQTDKIRGLNWMNNDWVNFGCTMSAVLVAMILWYPF